MKPRKAEWVTLQEISVEVHLSLSALNYYANLGLLRVVDRQGNTRLFSRSEITCRLEEIKRLQREGYPLRMICRQLLREKAAES